METDDMAVSAGGDACPCGSGRGYAQCCGPLHDGTAAPDAETLMRSRYSAYVLELGPYLLATWHADTRPQSLDSAGGDARLRWLGLRVKRHTPVDDTHAVVDFTSRFRVGGGRAQRRHEIARFVRADGRWFYVDSVFPEAEAAG